MNEITEEQYLEAKKIVFDYENSFVKIGVICKDASDFIFFVKK